MPAIVAARPYRRREVDTNRRPAAASGTSRIADLNPGVVAVRRPPLPAAVDAWRHSAQAQLAHLVQRVVSEPGACHRFKDPGATANEALHYQGKAPEPIELEHAQARS